MVEFESEKGLIVSSLRYKHLRISKEKFILTEKAYSNGLITNLNYTCNITKKSSTPKSSSPLLPLFTWVEILNTVLILIKAFQLRAF